MKCRYALYSIVLLLLLLSKAKGQNLVPNGNFEITNACPNDYSQMPYSTGWRSYHAGTSDFFHTCTSSSLVSVPNNVFGYQQPANGNGYVGLYTYLAATGYKEYIGRTINTLSPNVTYEVSMSVSLANYSGYSTTDLGMWFYDNGATASIAGTSSVILATPQVSYTSLGAVTDTGNWVRLVKTFIADSAYDNIVIGGFGSATTTGPVSTGFGLAPINQASYYYIDSVVIKDIKGISYVMPDTAYCSGDTLKLPFHVPGNGYYTSTNVFSLQLSDRTGSFASPVLLDTFAGGSDGIFKWVVPSTIINGTGYRVRIIATDHIDTSYSSRKIYIGTFPPARSTTSGNSPVCELNSLNLTAGNTTSGVSYVWSGPDNFSSTSQSPTRTNMRSWQGGQYVVTTWLFGCKTRDTVNVVVTPTVGIITDTATTPVCQNDTLKLYGNSLTTASTSFSWSGPNGFSATTKDAMVPAVTLAAAGNYVLTGAFSGCSSKDTVTVVVKPIPANLAITSSTPVCQGGTLTLGATTTSTGVSFNWSGPNSFSSTAQNPSLLNLQSSATGTYFLTGTLNGCIAKVNKTISVIPNAISISSNSPVCQGDTLRFSNTVTGTATGYSWTGPNFSSSVKDPVIANAPGTGSGMYYVITFISGGCQSRDSLPITVKPQVNHNTTSNSPICAGDSLTLFASTTATGVGFSWMGPSSFATTVQNPVTYNNATTASGKYIVSYFGTNGCYAYDTLSVVVNAAPLTVTASANTPVCQADTLKLAATNNVSGIIWTWTGPANFSSSVQNTGINSIPITGAGRYYVKAALANGCYKKDSVDVVVKAGAAGVVAGSNAPLCQGDTLKLNGASTTTGVSFSWTGPNGFKSGEKDTIVTGIQTAAAGKYVLIVGYNGCNIRDTEVVNITPTPPTPVPSANTPVCTGQTLNFYIGGSGTYTYSWTATTGFTSTLQNPSLPGANGTMSGTYSVKAMTGVCASAAATLNVKVLPAPVVTIQSVPGDSICEGATIMLVASAANAGTAPTYAWYYNDTLIKGAIATSYSATGHNNDKYFCAVIGNACADPYTDSSNAVHVQVFPWLIPSVAITADPGLQVNGGDMITFTGTTINAGNNPTYSWKLNNVTLPGAVKDTLQINTLNDQDVICLEMTSNYLCPQPPTVLSNCLAVNVNTTGIAKTKLIQGVSIYPNPVADELTIEGMLPGTKVRLFDVLGRIVINIVSTKEKETLNTSTLTVGTYLLQLTDVNGDRLSAKIIKE